MELAGRTGVVVGGGSGVGMGVAQALARAGMHTVVADVDVAAARTACRSGTAGEMRAVHADATDDRSLEQLARQACPDGSLDLLVTTVGAIDELGVDDLTDAHWAWAWELNVMAAVRTVRAFLPCLRRAVGSRIVLTGSGAGLLLPEPAPSLAAYVVSKHALTGYAQVLRRTLIEDGIGVTLLVPSGIEGNLAETSARSRRKYVAGDAAVRGRQPADRVLVPPALIGDLLVEGLRHDCDFVSNRGGDFHRGMADWIAQWERETSVAVVDEGEA